MKNSAIKRFIVLFIIFPSLVGGYALLLDSTKVNSELVNYSGGESEEEIKEPLPINPKIKRNNIDYKPIENTLNLSRIIDSSLDSIDNATDTVEYNLRTGVEKVSSREDSIVTTIPSIVEPFEGIVDPNYMLERARAEDDGGLHSSYVFPPDDRVEVTDTTIFPWRSICKLYIEADNYANYIGSGAIIDDYHVLTVGHVVYIHEAGGWVRDITVVPGMDDTYEPYGVASATNMRTYQGWIQSESYQHDWALLTLDRSIGTLTGWMGRQTEDYSSSVYTGTLNTAGYPGDLDFGEVMYACSDNGDRADEYNHWFWIDTYGGQSGSPIWRYDGSNRYILSILAYEYLYGTDANFGTRLNTDKYDQLIAWLAEDNGTVIDDKPDLFDRGLNSAVSRTDLIKGETSFEISCEVANEGTTAASSFDVSFYISTNTLITVSDYLLGDITINNLDPYTYATANWSGVIPSNVPDDSYYIGWIIDSGGTVDEFDENNNLGLLNYPLVEVVSQLPPDYGGILILVIIIIAVVSLASLTVILIVVRKRSRRIKERPLSTYQSQPYISSTSEVRKSFQPQGFKFCTNCGYTRFPNSNFCVKCGYKYP